jgi:hypothetical protein
MLQCFSGLTFSWSYAWIAENIGVERKTGGHLTTVAKSASNFVRRSKPDICSVGSPEGADQQDEIGDQMSQPREGHDLVEGSPNAG